MIRLLRNATIGMISIYVAVVLVLFAAQRSLIYPVPGPSVFVRVPDFHNADLITSDGLHLQALYRPARASLPTIIFFHGNGDSFSGAIEATRLLAQAGYGLLLPEYRGYGGNAGSPNETGLYKDGEASLRWLIKQGVTPDKIIIEGNSLGSGVATELSLRHRTAGLILVSGYTSLADVAAHRMPFIPARLLVLDRFDNISKLPNIKTPVLVVHGAADKLIPADQGASLAKAAPHSSFVLVPNVGHELAYRPVSQVAIMHWLRTAKRH